MRDLAELATELEALQVPLNQGRGVNAVRDVAMFLRRRQLSDAKTLCLREGDKITDKTLQEWIVNNLFEKGEKHPWSVLWSFRRAADE